MAGQASNPVPAMTVHHPLEKPVVVVGPQFLTQYPIDLTIANDFRVTDFNGTLIFSVKSKSMSIHDRRHLKDAAGNILVTLKEKIKTMHGRWQVFRGESTDEKYLLFSVKKSSLMRFRTQLDVFLASNTSESAPNFKVKGSSIYLGDGESNVIVAEMFKRHTFKTASSDTDSFAVTVYPNVDYAFIVALVVILDEINVDRSDKAVVVGAGVEAGVGAGVEAAVSSIISG
ncbi:hypothetical protein K2173_008448 [Erythroxylum novogranatense]|uniref:Uncharacterized protein n=1 Tax=Erythroxylum novogranatense TaxID=1862640 RepID=A0AAV8UBQ2_9ROSI|nr:hypothetical protein K2173_008448 [Erythroxylum novogranatense]